MDSFVEFVGLCVLTTQLASSNLTPRLTMQASSLRQNKVVVAIMPRVVSDPRRAERISAAPSRRINKMATPAAVHEVQGLGTEVETHTAMLIFHESEELQPVTGWTTHPLHPDGSDDWVYVELTGEQIVFNSDLSDVDITPSFNSLAIPHLGNTPLTTPYRPPGYPGAAAVFMISKGRLAACQNPVSPDGALGRVDTTLALATDRKLVITTTVPSQQKNIVLTAGAHVTAANVPIAFATMRTVTANAHNHFRVYCAMLGKQQCAWPPPPPSTSTQTDQVGACGADLAVRLADGVTPPLPAQANDFACSNTQWP